MNQIPATEAKNRFGELLEAIHREPVAISKKGRPVAIILSVSEYEQMLSNASSGTEAPDIKGILRWIDRHPPKGLPIDEADYSHHLNEKFK